MYDSLCLYKTLGTTTKRKYTALPFCDCLRLLKKNFLMAENNFLAHHNFLTHIPLPMDT